MMSSEIKRNHYIPRFYLRNFTVNPLDDKSRFDLYNLKSKTLLKQIPYKEQMREKYFYEKGSDIDHKLNIEFEGLHSSVLQNILNDGEPEHQKLLEIILLMHFRTRLERNDTLLFRKFMIDQNIDYLESSFKRYLKNKGVECDDLDLKEMVRRNSYKAYLDETYSAEKNIENFERVSKEISGLSTCVFKNDTGIKFISSDRPVIRINPFLSERIENFGIDGLFQLGVILMLPINPHYLIVAFDSSIYQSPNDHELTESDVEEINKRQLLQAQIGVYSSTLKTEFKSLADKVREIPVRHAMVKVSLPDDHFMYYKEEGFPAMKLGFVETLEQANSIKLTPPFARGPIKDE